jgi:hypothetical protein
MQIIKTKQKSGKEEAKRGGEGAHVLKIRGIVFRGGGGEGYLPLSRRPAFAVCRRVVYREGGAKSGHRMFK